VEQFVRKKLMEEQWSPQQIAGQAKLHAVAMVSHERIYQLIRKDKAQGGSPCP
jgi:IS30 family transposase